MPDNPYTEMMQGQSQTANARAVGVGGTPPDQAAKAIDLLPQQPSKILADPKAFAEQKQANDNTQIVKQSPAMSRWASGDPAYVAASQDHFSWMNEFSYAWDALKRLAWAPPEEREKGTLGQVALAGLKGVPAEVGKEMAQSFGAIIHPETEIEAISPLEKWLSGNAPDKAIQRQLAMTRALDPFQQAQNLLGVPWSLIQGPLTSTVGRPVEKEIGIRKELVGQVLSMLVPLGAKAKGGGPEVSPGEAAVSTAEKAASPEAAHAEDNAKIADALHSTVAQSGLQARSPAVMAEFLKQQSEGSPLENLKISADKIAQLYTKRGIAPHSEDGALGWVPNLAKKLHDALLSGSDVEVPLAEYMTKVDEVSHAELRDGIRLGEAPSVEDAKAQEPSKEGEEGKAPLKIGGTTSEPQAKIAKSVDAQRAADRKAALERVKQAQYLRPLFQSAKSAGMTEEQFKLYSEKIHEADEKATESLRGLVAKQAEREQSSSWKEATVQTKPEVQQETFERPDIIARHFLTYGELPDGQRPIGGFKLDESASRQAMPFSPSGKAFGEALPEEIFGKNGRSPDEVAELFGYPSGEALLRDLSVLHENNPELSAKQDLNRIITEGTRARVAGQLGDFLSPEGLLAAARESVALPPLRGLLIKELKTLADLAKLPFDEAKMETKAEGIFSRMIVKDGINIKNLEKISARNGRAAEIFLLKDRVEPAFMAKQRQAISQLILDQAHDLQKDYLKANTKFTKWAKLPTFSGMAQEYVNWIHDMLQTVGYSVAREPEELKNSLQGQTFENFFQGKEAQGYDIAVYPIDKEISLVKQTVEDFRGIRDMLLSLAHNARLESSIAKGVERIELASAVNSAKDQFADRGDNRYTLEQLHGEGWARKARAALQGVIAPIRSLGFLIKELDNHNPHGIYDDVLLRPMQGAAHLEDKLSREFQHADEAFAKTLPKDWNDRLDQKIDLPHFDYVDKDGDHFPIIKDRRSLLGAIMHLGTDLNSEKLLKGYNWDEPALLSEASKYINADDVRFLEHLWGKFEPLWSKIEDFTRERSGVAPPKVKPRTFRVGNFSFKGGYAPLFPDTRFTSIIDDIQAHNRDPFDRLYAKATPPRGYSIARTKSIYPVDISLDNIERRIKQVLHDISFREPIMDGMKFIQQHAVRNAIEKTLGPAYYKQFPDWFKRVANSASFDERALDGWSSWIAQARMNMNFVGLAYRASPVSLHFMSALAKSGDEIGWGHLIPALMEFARHPKETYDFVIGKSLEIPGRLNNYERDSRDAIKALYKKQRFLAHAQRFGFHTIGLSDQASSVPTWLATYRKLLGEGETEADAITRADQAVVRAHGSGHPVNVSNFLGSNSQFVRALTPFMTFMSNTFDRVAESGARPGGAKRDFTKVLADGFWKLMPLAAVTLLVKGRAQEENWVKAAGEAVAENVVGGIPVLREFLSALQYKRDLKVSPLESAGQSLIESAQDAAKAGTGHSPSKQWVKHAIETPGYIFGIPGAGQAATSAQYLWDVMNRRQRPQSLLGPGGFISGILYGAKRKDK